MSQPNNIKLFIKNIENLQMRFFKVQKSELSDAHYRNTVKRKQKPTKKW